MPELSVKDNFIEVLKSAQSNHPEMITENVDRIVTLVESDQFQGSEEYLKENPNPEVLGGESDE